MLEAQSEVSTTAATTSYPLAGWWTRRRTLRDHEEIPQSQAILQDFDKIAPSYNRLHRSKLYQGLLIEMAMGLSSGGKIVEVGCGLGVLSRRLSTGAKSVVGVDGSAEMVERAKTGELPINLRFVKAESSEVGRTLGPVEADLVVSAFVLHDQSNPVEHLLAWSKLLRAGGCILIVDRYWERGPLGQTWSFLRMEAWMWRQFRKLGFGILRSMALMTEDLREWFSAPWRRHREHEFQRTYSESQAFLRCIDSKVEVRKINTRAYIAVLHPEEVPGREVPDVSKEVGRNRGGGYA